MHVSNGARSDLHVYLVPVVRAILVYNSDNTLRGKLADVLRKAVGRKDCTLCELTHGALGKRGSWAACEARLPVPVAELHRDELPVEWRIARSDLPCVLVQSDDGLPMILVTRAEIGECRGNARALEKRMLDALDAP